MMLYRIKTHTKKADNLTYNYSDHGLTREEHDDTGLKTYSHQRRKK
jgi:hypothetical protein